MIVTNVRNPRDLNNDSDLKNILEHRFCEQRVSDFLVTTKYHGIHD